MRAAGEGKRDSRERERDKTERERRVFTEASGSMIPACGVLDRCHRHADLEENQLRRRSYDLAGLKRYRCAETAGRRASMETTRRAGWGRSLDPHGKT